MWRYLLRRAAESLIVLFVMSFVIYGLLGLMPGDPVDMMIQSNPKLTAGDIQQLREIYGLDRPILQRYLAWLGNALSGDFGYSRLFALPVEAILLPRLGNTLMLMGAAFVIAFGIALPAGIAAARRPWGLTDGLVNLTAFAGISLPPFWLAILLIILFSVTLGWLPAGGMGDGSLSQSLLYMVLPVTTLTLAAVGSHIRFVRAAMMEALRQDHIRTARAKGLKERQVVYGHALRNAMIPIVTILALDFGTLFSGALITETMFGWLGMGKTIYDAIMGNDYNLALIGLLMATFVVLLANLLADIAYGWLDPRVTYR